MKLVNIFKLALALCSLSSATFSFVAHAKNSSQVNTNIPKQCELLFTKTERLVKNAEKQPGTHFQMVNIKDQINNTKKRILAMEPETQIKSCNKGLVALNNLNQS